MYGFFSIENTVIVFGAGGEGAVGRWALLQDLSHVLLGALILQ